MPRFMLKSPEAAKVIMDFVAADSGDILNMMQRAHCRHADVYREETYLFSARLNENEVWSLYYRSDRDGGRAELPASPWPTPSND